MGRNIKIKKGDNVAIISGESKGVQGRIIKVYPKTQRVLVEGENVKKITRHVKPNNNNPKGGIIKDDMPIHISNIMLVDPATGNPARFGVKKDKKGNLERIFKTKTKEGSNK